jgi:AraC-like DNA-binding protein
MVPAPLSTEDVMRVTGGSRHAVAPGCWLNILAFRPSERMVLPFFRADTLMEFGFALSGKARVVVDAREPGTPGTFMSAGRSGDGCLEVGSGTIVAHYAPNVYGRFEVDPAAPVTMVGVEVEIERLLALLEEGGQSWPDLEALAARPPRAPFVRPAAMSALERSVVHQIVACPFRGTSRKLFLQSKALELLAYRLERMTDGPAPSGPAPVGPDVVERVRRARELLRQGMDEPPGLGELAAAVGVNTTTLKRGFRAVFDKTAFGCLHEDRMARAGELLQQGRMNVSEVAWEIGYTNVGHFSVAFRKHFGVRPREYRSEAVRRFQAVR